MVFFKLTLKMTQKFRQFVIPLFFHHLKQKPLHKLLTRISCSAFRRFSINEPPIFVAISVLNQTSLLFFTCYFFQTLDENISLSKHISFQNMKKKLYVPVRFHYSYILRQLEASIANKIVANFCCSVNTTTLID